MSGYLDHLPSSLYCPVVETVSLVDIGFMHMRSLEKHGICNGVIVIFLIPLEPASSILEIEPSHESISQNLSFSDMFECMF